MKIAIATLYVTDCRHVKVTKHAGTESIEIDFDHGAFVVLATGDPELEIENNEDDVEEQGK
jgi:phage-related protein